MPPSRQAFVPGFDNDLFISYGHIDNEGDKWIEKLHERLETRLAQLLGSKVHIWRDPKIGGMDLVWDVIEEQISKSAVFLAVLSPRYVQSNACQREATCFSGIIKKSGMPFVGNTSRIIRVLKTFYEEEEPASIREWETLGYQFYEPKKEGPGFREFPADKALDGYQKFLDQSEQLAQSLARLLRTLKEARTPTSRQPSGQKIFVAYATSDKANARKTVIKALEEKGYTVLPTENQPSTKSELQGILETHVPACSVAVHLMGRSYGMIPEEEQEHRSIIQLQFDWIRDKAIRQLVWIPEDLKSSDNVETEQLRFLDTIKSLNDNLCDVINSSLWPFIYGVIEQLKKSESKPRYDRTKSVFLLFNEADLTDSSRLLIRKYLRDHGYPVDESAFEGDEGPKSKLDENSILGNTATLIYYGSSTDVWIQTQRQILRKVLAPVDSGKKRIRALYLCVPENDYKRVTFLPFSGATISEADGFSPLLVIGDCKPFTPQKLEPLMNRLEEDEP